MEQHRLKRFGNDKNSILSAYRNNVTYLLSELSIMLCGHSTNDVINALKKFRHITIINKKIKKRNIQLIMVEKLKKVEQMISEFDINAQSF